MTEQKSVFVRRYFLITICAALLLCAFVLLRWQSDKRIDTADERIDYLASLGWNCDAASEQYREIQLPDEFAGIMADYNELQKRNGFDLTRCAGEKCSQYTYSLTEHAGSLTVYAVIYVYRGRVIGGDIHTAAIDGYMHGLREIR